MMRRDLQSSLGTLVVGLVSVIGMGGAPASAAAPPQLADLPLAAQATVSATLGRDSAAYHLQPTRAGYHARTPAQDLRADFSAAGVRVCAAGGECARLALDGYGYGDTWHPVRPARPQAAANRVEYQRGAVTEWYVNGPLGVEQGFTLTAAPAHGPDGAPLTVVVALAGGVTATAEGDGVRLVRSDGQAVARYRGLSAVDATGRELPMRLEARGRQVLLRVDDRGAHYPVVIDPFIETAKLTASDGALGDQLGVSVAISGDTLVAGAPFAKVGSNTQQGAAYVFVKAPTGWASMTETAKLTASDGATNDQLGLSVAISGDTVVAGAHRATIGSNTLQGAAYVFVKAPTGWASMTETAKLTASDGAANDELGISVAISGDTVVAGAYGATIGSNSFQGAAYVFVKAPTGWASMTETAKLTASDGATNDQLGLSVAISGDTVVAGAIGSNTHQGAAYVFVKPPTGWASMTETAKLTASDGATNDQLGLSVAISGDTVVAGAYRAKIGSNTQQGAAYVFVKAPTGWASMTETAKLTASDGAANDMLGVSVAISGDTVVAGANRATIGSNLSQGAAYVFVKAPAGWASMTETAKLTASDGAASDRLGTSVAISGDTVVAGANFARIGSNTQQGAAYVFQSSTSATHVAPAASVRSLLIMALLLSGAGIWRLRRWRQDAPPTQGA